MFLVNSRLGLVSATLNAFTVNAIRIRSPLSRSYGGILPSSFTTILSIALVFSTYPPVSVWGTGGSYLAHEAFLGSIGSLLPHQRCGHIMSQASRSTDLPILHPTHLTRHSHSREELPSCVPPQLAYYKIRSQTHTTHQPEGLTECLACLASLASTGTSLRRYGNINPLSIDYACRPRLRSRLTQGRLA